MPTPFYHLSIAQKLCTHPKLPHDLKWQLNRFTSAFYLGHIAPDVQVLTRQKRPETHFYTIPTTQWMPLPWEKMLATCPGLDNPPDPEQAVFIAGYLCHLQVDWYWTKEIYEPVFGPFAAWSTRKDRAYRHNVLRTYIDQIVVKALESNTGEILAAAHTQNRLPFVADSALQAWRDFLAEQLQPGAKPQTVEVFAQRQGLDPQVFYNLLNSESAMRQQIFNRYPRQKLTLFAEKMVAKNLKLVQEFLKPPVFHSSKSGDRHESF